MSVVDRAGLVSWIALYEELWRTRGTDRLGELFTEDGVYRHSPYEEPVVGLPAIAEDWERGRDGADEEFTMSAEVVAVDRDTAVGTTRTPPLPVSEVDGQGRDRW